ncbi:hypothetical protein ZWY2020_034534, partial [Hordeum vulgare]
HATIDVLTETMASAMAGMTRLPERVSITWLLDFVSDHLLKLNNNLKSPHDGVHGLQRAAAEEHTRAHV